MQIDISDTTFARIQKHAVPLVDTVDSVLERALNALDSDATCALPVPPSALTRGPTIYASKNPPVLTHTKVLNVSIDGQPLAANLRYWNRIMRLMLEKMVTAGYTGKALLPIMVVPATLEKKTDDGFSYYQNAEISIQGQDSIGAWKQIVSFAEELGASLEVTFAWSDNPKAPYPGLTGFMKV